MADVNDIEEFRLGSADMARSDLSDGAFPNLVRPDTDFTEAKLERANFAYADLRRSKLERANMMKMNGTGVNLEGSYAPSTVFYGVIFQGAKLRGSNFKAAHFTGVNFSDADLRGVDFSNAYFNDGMKFENAIIDATTNFDGAKAMRATARSPIFQDYDYERGSFKRKTIKQEEPAIGSDQAASPRSYTITAEPGAYSLNPPAKRISGSTGVITFDYSNDNGVCVIGSGDKIFHLKWTRASNEAIYSYQNPPSVIGVAIAKGAQNISDVEIGSLKGVNFSSTFRNPRIGQILIALNQSSYVAVIKIIRVLAVGYNSEVDELTFEYTIWDRPVPVAPETPSLEIQSEQVGAPVMMFEDDDRITTLSKEELFTKISDAEASLARLLKDESKRPVPIHGGVGHNNPPEELPLDFDDAEELRQAFAMLKEQVVAETVDEEKLKASKAKIIEAADNKITQWVLTKGAVVGDAFLAKFGDSMADYKFWITGWLFFSGELHSLVEYATKLLGH